MRLFLTSTFAFAAALLFYAPMSYAQATAARDKASAKSVAIADGKIELSPSNTTIQFVGTHLGDNPDPRTGYFTKFTGAVEVDEAKKSLASIEVDIDAPSLTTSIDRLTGHLKSPDFFDVRQYPKATFKSAKIEPVDGKPGTFQVTGDLTIRDETKPVSFPATLKLDGNGAILASKFEISRKEFGMTFGPDRVADEVELTVTVGKATPKGER